MDPSSQPLDDVPLCHVERDRDLFGDHYIEQPTPDGIVDNLSRLPA